MHTIISCWDTEQLCTSAASLVSALTAPVAAVVVSMVATVGFSSSTAAATTASSDFTASSNFTVFSSTPVGRPMSWSTCRCPQIHCCLNSTRTYPTETQSQGQKVRPYQNIPCAHLDSYMQLGSAFGWARSLKGCAVHLNGHSEDRNMNWSSLRYQFVLETWLQLIEPHQSIHRLGRLSLLLWSW